MESGVLSPGQIDSTMVDQIVEVQGEVIFIDEGPDGLFVGIFGGGKDIGVFVENRVYQNLATEERAQFEVGNVIIVKGFLLFEYGELTIQYGEKPKDLTTSPPADQAFNDEVESICSLTIENENQEIKAKGVVRDVFEDEFGYTGIFTNYELRTGYYTTSPRFAADICWVGIMAEKQQVDSWSEEVKTAFFEGHEILVEGWLVALEGPDPDTEYALTIQMFEPPQITGAGEFIITNKVEPGWYDEVNIFDNGMGGLMPGFTVLDSGPSAEIPEEVGQLQPYVEGLNNAGIPTAGQIMIRNMGDPRVLDIYPELEVALALDIDGNIMIDWAGVYPPSIPYVGCTFHPEWQEFLRMQVRRLVDGGINVIFFDAPAGSSYTASDERNNGDFNPIVMEAFRDYLKATYSEAELSTLGISNIDTFNYREWIIDNGYASRVRNYGTRLEVPLWNEFHSFLVRGEQQHNRDLLEYARGYINQQGRDTALTMNFNDSNLTVLPLMDLVDYYWCEYYYLENYPNITRTTPTIRLNNAWGKRSVHHPGTGKSVPRLIQMESTTTLLKTWIAEAYANGSGFQAPTGFGGTKILGENEFTVEIFMPDMEKLEPYYQFIMANQASCSEMLTLADVTLVYHAPSEWGNTYSYRQLFIETSLSLLKNNIQYNVLFLDGRPKAGVLNTQIAVLPKPTVPLTSVEEAAIANATIIYYDQDSTVQSLREAIFTEVQPIVEVGQPGVEAYVFEHEGQLVVNLTNQTYNIETDSVSDIKDVTISLFLPDSRTVAEVQLLSPDGDINTPLLFEQRDNVLSLVVPDLHVWDVLFIR
ncbi:hypothetical protein ACFLVM_00600 [Chloroflexota bacterium]